MPARFAQFPPMCDSTCCAVEWYIWLSSVFFSCAYTGVWNRSYNVRRISETFSILQNNHRALSWRWSENWRLKELRELVTEEVVMPWPVTWLRTSISGSWFQLKSRYFGSCKRLACLTDRVSGRQGKEGFTHTVLLLSTIYNLLICRKEWTTTSGFKHLSHKLRDVLDITQDISAHRIRACGLLEILVPFTRNLSIYRKCGHDVFCHVPA